MGRRGETYCQWCGDPLDAGSEFVFLVEIQVYHEEVAPLDPAWPSPCEDGEPLRTCKECRASIEQNRLDILERAAEEDARSRRYRRVLSVVVMLVLLVFLGLIVADLRR